MLVQFYLIIFQYSFLILKFCWKDSNKSEQKTFKVKGQGCCGWVIY